VGKVSVGAIRDFRFGKMVKIGIGAVYAINSVPQTLSPVYASSNPRGAMAFIRLKIE
jgi:hypothetical protein